MGCDECREALSAGLDGEDGPVERGAADAHLDICPQCQEWYDNAALVTRLARTGAVPVTFTVDDAVLAALPARPTVRATAGRLLDRVRGPAAVPLRIALGVLGLAQFLLGAAQIGGLTAASHLHGVAGVEGANHLWHESAAWNVALGAGFAWIALRRVRPTGILPTLTAFVVVLTLLTTDDLIGGRVEFTRVLSHSLIVLGFLVVLALSRVLPDPGTPPVRRPDRGRWRATFDDVAEPAEPVPGLRIVRSAPPAQATADTRRAA
ncbi:zf-HC2 domain-containing protein [Polymorphospora rubra]|uniref:zf-HC2 domain-containing protein n=1 Tax=Polymorphospora rubra TaxID=338584 RepID=UPI003F4CE336